MTDIVPTRSSIFAICAPGSNHDSGSGCRYCNPPLVGLYGEALADFQILHFRSEGAFQGEQVTMTMLMIMTMTMTMTMTMNMTMTMSMTMNVTTFAICHYPSR